MLPISYYSNNIDNAILRIFKTNFSTLTVEQINELLLKNHDLRPICFKVVPKAHVASNKRFGHFRGCGRRKGHDF